MLNRLWNIPNPKHQITNKFKYLNSKQTLSKSVLNIGILTLSIVWHLGFVVWNFNPLDIEQIPYIYSSSGWQSAVLTTSDITLPLVFLCYVMLC